MQEHWKNKYIVFFDGECGVCNFWVQWILERDTKDQFMFSEMLPARFESKEKIYLESI